MEPMDPRLSWLCICIRALMTTHPQPQKLRAVWIEMAETLIAHQLAASRDETRLEALIALRDGYEAWLPPDAPAAA